MIKHSAEYDKAIISDSRMQYVRSIFDLLDPDAVFNGYATNTESVQSKSDQLANRGVDETTEKAVTLEYNRWKLDGTWDIVDPPDLQGQRGWEGDSICDSDGNFSEPFPYVSLSFSNIEILQAVTLQFSQYEYNGVPSDFVVEILSENTVLASKEYTGNENASVIFDGFTANFPDELKITIKKWSIGNRRPRVIQYLPGLYEQWDGKIIKNIEVYTESTFSGLSIPYSTCTLEVYNENKRFDPYSPNSIFKSIEDRQAVKVELGLRLEDKSIEWVPAGTYFQQSNGWNLQSLTVQWDLLDIIGMLVNRRFVVPDTLPTILGVWIESIMSSLGTNFRNMYVVDEDIYNIPLTAKKEDVTDMKCGDILRYACMASNTWPHQDFSTGYLRISKIERVEGNKITLDNMPSYPTMSENNSVSDITFKLDNDSQGKAQEVTFPGTNTESNQSLSIKNPFVHTTEDAQKAFASCMLEYGGRRFSVLSRGNPSSETGDLMSIQTQFGTEISARLLKQQLKLDQGIMRNVTSELVQSPNDSVYENKIVLTGSGTYNTEIEGTIKITLIQGGTGGQGGGGGIMTGTFSQDETEGGNPGEGGKVYITEIDTALAQPFVYSCGLGGTAGQGGAAYKDGEKGTEGGETTFGQFTSANGNRYSSGIMDVSTGNVYAAPGSKVSGLYGTGGQGGKFGDNGYEYENDEGNIVVGARPEPGTAGTDGKDGCIIVEW